ncbi:MAG: hypothetical protein ACFFD4_37850 [Candidatus Odinarchaeota archaeon]
MTDQVSNFSANRSFHVPCGDRCTPHLLGKTARSVLAVIPASITIQMKTSHCTIMGTRVRDRRGYPD